MITKDACRSMVFLSDIYGSFVDTAECVLMIEIICLICFSTFVLTLYYQNAI